MKIGIVPARGLGDGLIFLSLAHYLRESGREVVVQSPALEGLGPWARGVGVAEGALVLQHDNSEAMRSRIGPETYVFYGAHVSSKHGALRERDYVCDQSVSMLENVMRASQRWFGGCGRECGLVVPEGLVHRRHRRRVAIHPTSIDGRKAWGQKKFTQVAEWLVREGFEPIFIVRPEERAEWGGPLFTSFAEIAQFLFESGAFLGNDSGLGHLASCLEIPHCVVAPSAAQMRFWGPDWHPGAWVVPPRLMTHWRWTRQRWQRWVSANAAIHRLKTEVLIN